MCSLHPGHELVLKIKQKYKLCIYTKTLSVVVRFEIQRPGTSRFFYDSSEYLGQSFRGGSITGILLKARFNEVSEDFSPVG